MITNLQNMSLKSDSSQSLRTLEITSEVDNEYLDELAITSLSQQPIMQLSNYMWAGSRRVSRIVKTSKWSIQSQKKTKNGKETKRSAVSE